MVGPFMQGMLLLGVMYWYTKGMLNMINDYYRSEFQKQLETNPVEKQSSGADEIERLLKIQNEIQETILRGESFEADPCKVKSESEVCFNEKETKRFLKIVLPMSICYVNNEVFLENIKKKTEECELIKESTKLLPT